MLDIKFIRDNPEKVKEAARSKKVDVDIDLLLEKEMEMRGLQTRLDELNRERNNAAEQKDIQRGKELKQQIAVVTKSLQEVGDEFVFPLLLKVPNIPSEDTPVGPNETGNVVLRQMGTPTEFDFEPKDHMELGTELDLIDTERATEVAGARFVYLKGELVLLQNALMQFVFSILTNADTIAEIIRESGLKVSAKTFVPIAPPLFIKPEVMQKMARLEPRDERYHIPSDDVYLIGSAEHTLGPLHMGETLKEADLPLRYVACTPAFRREAGSYGKDTRGILRLHQFDKIEMESFSLAEQSLQEQDFFVALQEYFLQSLGIPYQVVQICTGDMGGPDARQIDMECWMPGQKRYRETHTSDLMTDYQARRLGIRVKRAGKNEYVHMNDATAVAMGRLLIAILENFQQADGTVRVPEVLVPYCGFKTIGKKK